MKKILAFMAFYYLAAALWAQSPAINDFYLFSPLLINPALAGRNANPTFTQISRVPTDKIDGGPQRYLLAYEQGIKAINSGVGAVVAHERLGIHSEWRQTLMYNYRFKFSNGNELALGGAGFHSQRESDFSRLGASPTHWPLTGQIKSVSFGYQLGISYSFLKNTTVGMSLFNYPYSPSSGFLWSVPEVHRTQYVLVFVEQDVRVSKWLRLTPSILFVSSDLNNAMWNLNATAHIGSWAFVGAQYSNSDGINNPSNVFAGVCFRDVAKVGVRVLSKKPLIFPNRSPGLSFMLQVSPRKREKETSIALVCNGGR